MTTSVLQKHLAPDLDAAIDRAADALLAKQHPDGYWVGELQGDSILESEYLLMKFILEQDADPDLPKIANHLRSLQNPDGGWSLYPGGPADVSGTVKAYFALKLCGDDPAAPHMVKAKELALNLGGVEATNSFTKFYFAALGELPWDACPAIPPEIVYLPRWAYFNLYNVSAWTRTMILPLALVTTLRPTRRLPPEQSLRELFVGRPEDCVLGRDLKGVPTGWADAFLRIDRLLKRYNLSANQTLRAAAIRRCERWLFRHMDASEGLGAIFPPMVYMLIVLRALGYPDDHPRVVKAHQELRDFYIEENGAIRLQPCLSPVWDTGIAMHALAESGLTSEDKAAKRASRWLLGKEVRFASDWKRNVKQDVEPSGWFFEFENPHYPDTDDTAMACMSLKRLGGEPAADAIGRGVKWLLAMQNADGGWAAFDRTTDRPVLEKVPFADHNAMQDPSCPDITGRVMEGLGRCGLTVDHPAIQTAVRYLRRERDAGGGWWGRWGVNYVYGTWQVLTGLKAVGQEMGAPFVAEAAAWLRAVQHSDGSWGESCASYDDPAMIGKGEPTASQTAWGTMGLLAAAGSSDPAAQRGIRWLIDHQAADGAWDEQPFTGTGFPKVFYLKYHLYRHYFPLMALARYRRLGGA